VVSASEFACLEGEDRVSVYQDPVAMMVASDGNSNQTTISIRQEMGGKGRRLINRTLCPPTFHLGCGNRSQLKAHSAAARLSPPCCALVARNSAVVRVGAKRFVWGVLCVGCCVWGAAAQQ